AAERDRLDPVLRLALVPRPDGRTEPHHVLGHLDPELLGGHEVTDLVQGDRQADAEGDDEHADDVGDHAGFLSRPSTSRARLRAQASARSTVSTSRSLLVIPASEVCVWSSTTRAMVSTMSVNRIVPSK